MRETQLYRAFLDSVHAASDARRKLSGASGLGVAGMPLAWTIELEAHAGKVSTALPEDDMQRITKQLDEYTSVCAKRAQLERLVVQRRVERTDAASAFVKRLRALVLAEEKLHAVAPTMSLSLLVITESLRDCTECAQSETFYSDFEQLLEAHADAASGDDRVSVLLDEPSLATLAADTAAFVTVRYVEKRLAALPTRLHTTFLFLVSLGIAEADGERVEAATLRALLADDVLRDLPANLVAPTRYFPVVRLKTDVSRGAVVHQLATYVVSLATEAALLSVSHKRASDVNFDKDNDSSRARIARLDAPLRLAFLRIQTKFTRTRQGQVTFTTELLVDMLEHASYWREYLRQQRPSASTALAFDASTRVLCLLPHALPRILTRLTPLEQLLMHLCLFDSVSISQLHAFVASQVGDALLQTLATRVDTEAKRSLASVAKTCAFSTPLVLVSTPSCQATAGLSSILQCAQRLSVRDDALSCISLGSDTSVPDFRLGEFSHTNLIANANAMHYAEAVKSLNGIKESSLSGGWIVVKDTVFVSLAATNALRQQVESMKRLHSNKSNDFRLWIHHELAHGAEPQHNKNTSALMNCRGLSFAAHDFVARLPAERRFIEFPQTLAQYYATHMCLEAERAAEQSAKQQQSQSHASPRRPKLMSRRSSFSVGQSQATGLLSPDQVASTEQWWLHAALWVFHAVFRLHVDAGGSSVANNSGRTVPSAQCTSHEVTTDLLVSHFELERSLRLLQLHTRQKALAATAALPSGGSQTLRGARASESSRPSSETRAMVDLVTIVYMGRQSTSVCARQCHELLEWCFATKSAHLHHALGDAHAGGGRDAPSTQLRSQLVGLREQILQKKLASATGELGESSSRPSIELACLPLRLQHERQCQEAASLLQSLRATALAPAAMNESSERQTKCCLAAVQRTLRRVVEALPHKTSLSSSVEQQRIQRRSTIFAAYRRGTRAASTTLAEQTLSTGAHFTAAWQRALVTHLMEVELPAIEAYLQYVWRMSELVLSLTPESHDAAVASSSSNAFYREILAVLEALSAGAVPVSWRAREHLTLGSDSANGNDNAMYAMPTRLSSWQSWLSRATAFYQRVRERPKHLVDVVWIPAMQHPRGSYDALSVRCWQMTRRTDRLCWYSLDLLCA